ncbi:MAG: heme exporter protein CcmD [Gammaproteobacteria bacterium]|jgi:heme exporter protein D|nr:heme exporter protein CcmD [Gammaproteobacteria bacterium]MBQ0773802.1 heme exporter protein CcmD [Gammaproteobacteria bacterium]|tara:strand:+ start:19703 stop:19897 length:195 start_codon:yes stop_codon:yes gene_type:complete
MYFESFDAFLQMGKHGIYVWSAYGISALLIGLNIGLALRARTLARAEVIRLIRREALNVADSTD